MHGDLMAIRRRRLATHRRQRTGEKRGAYLGMQRSDLCRRQAIGERARIAHVVNAVTMHFDDGGGAAGRTVKDGMFIPATGTEENECLALCAIEASLNPKDACFLKGAKVCLTKPKIQHRAFIAPRGDGLAIDGQQDEQQDSH